MLTDVTVSGVEVDVAPELRPRPLQSGGVHVPGLILEGRSGLEDPEHAAAGVLRGKLLEVEAPADAADVGSFVKGPYRSGAAQQLPQHEREQPEHEPGAEPTRSGSGGRVPRLPAIVVGCLFTRDALPRRADGERDHDRERDELDAANPLEDVVAVRVAQAQIQGCGDQVEHAERDRQPSQATRDDRRSRETGEEDEEQDRDDAVQDQVGDDREAEDHHVKTRTRPPVRLTSCASLLSSATRSFDRNESGIAATRAPGRIGAARGRACGWSHGSVRSAL